MNTTERIKHATSPQDAMMILALALDSIHAEIQELKEMPKVAIEPSFGDPWAPWTPTIEAGTHTSGEIVERLEEHLEDLHDAVNKADGEERQVLEAQIRLAQDQLNARPVDHAEVEGLRSRLEITEGGDTIVDLPPVNESWKEHRRKMARDIGLEGEMIEYYVKGGPLWLYYGDRDYVTGLTPEWRRAMVRDVEKHSPAEAHEFARDVLKDTSAGQSVDYAEEQL